MPLDFNALATRFGMSYGAVPGRTDELWNRRTPAPSPERMLPLLAASGFAGIYLEGAGYADHGTGEIAQFSAALGGAAPLLSRVGRLAYFDLTPHLVSLVQPLPRIP